MQQNETNPLREFIHSDEYNILQKLGAIIFYSFVTLVGSLADQFHVSYNDPDSQE